MLWSLLSLTGLVALVLWAGRTPRLDTLFRWLPVPLWCYALPMLLRTAGWLPMDRAASAWITDQIFPIALVLLLLGVDLPALSRLGRQALAAMAVGVCGILLGGPILWWLFRTHLPADGWKGIGALAGTWTGGSLNMIALRGILEVPDDMFAPLIVVDALVAYGWMACLVALKGAEPRLNRWLRAIPLAPDEEPARAPRRRRAAPRSLVWIAVAGIGLASLCRWLSALLPVGGMVASTTGWTILLATTVTLLLSLWPAARQLGQDGMRLGYPCLYVVLAALGAQANLNALIATPVWIVVGIGWLACHALLLLIGGRLLRAPFGVLATVSQANVGGMVSAPLVGAVYDARLAPVGLLLAIGANAVGTYLGLWAATLARWLG